jgi:hypothetical protein
MADPTRRTDTDDPATRGAVEAAEAGASQAGGTTGAEVTGFERGGTVGTVGGRRPEGGKHMGEQGASDMGGVETAGAAVGAGATAGGAAAASPGAVGAAGTSRS